VISGRVWKFGDNINTDMMMPGPALYLPEAERIRYIFQANRPGWVDAVRRGDFIIGGKSYGVGSSRPAALSLRNVGLLALECPGVHAMFEEGQTATVSTDDLTIRNEATGEVRKALPVPRQLVDLMCGGGIFPLLESQGLIAPLPAKSGKGQVLSA
jgi:3-isopropylmalate/(R)-2-methylmalate dehydratase small subunit